MRELTEALRDVAAYDISGPGINLTGGDLPVLVKGVRVSAEYFRLFGAPVTLGRAFTPEEDRPGSGNFVVISDALWHSRFGADRGIVGRSISLGGAPYLVVGVIGPAFVLIACTNVANLLLARATGRRREIAIRAALGAARRDIVRQLLTESLLLSIAGGIAGLGLGYAVVRALLSFYPGDIPRIGEHGAAVSLDWRVLTFTVGVSILTGILFGLIPALNASRADLNSMIGESGSRSSLGLRQNKAGATLLIRTFAALRSVNPGFDSQNILTMQMSLAGPAFEKTSSVARLVRDARERIGVLPGVEAVAGTPSVPLEPSLGLGFDIEGRPQVANQGGGSRR